MAALVKRHRPKLRSFPGSARPEADARRREWGPIRPAEHEAGCAVQTMADQVVAEDRGGGDFPSAREGLRLDPALLDVPGSLDPDHTAGEINIAPPQRSELSAAQSRVERGRPKHSVRGRRRLDEPGRPVWR